MLATKLHSSHLWDFKVNKMEHSWNDCAY